jgi:hypothetical protein
MHLKRLQRDDVPTGDASIQSALDQLYDHFDALFHSRSYEKVDEILQSLIVESMSTTMLIGYLTATLPAKSKLSHRAAFFRSVKRELAKRGDEDESLLQGLE